jgi:hypothetical protein
MQTYTRRRRIFAERAKTEYATPLRYFSWWRAARRESEWDIYMMARNKGEKRAPRQERILVDLLLRATNYQKEKESAHNKYSWACMVW